MRRSLYFAAYEQALGFFTAWFFWHTGHEYFKEMAWVLVWVTGYLACWSLICWEREQVRKAEAALEEQR